MPPHKRPLPHAVYQAREEWQRVNAANGELLEELIELHLTCYDAALALAELAEAHRRISDETALELDGRSRDSAMWLITGRCLGLGRAAHRLAVDGYVLEVVPVLRSMHEAARLLAVFDFAGEEDLEHRWLRDKSVGRGDIMAAQRRQEAAMRVEMIKAGVAPPGETTSYFEKQFGRWSEIAHHRRRHLLNQVSVPNRHMPIGPHPDWRVRAVTVDHFGWYVLELVSTCGSALAQLRGPTWTRHRFQPTWRALMDFKDRIPLGEIAEGRVAPPASDETGTA